MRILTRDSESDDWRQPLLGPRPCMFGLLQRPRCGAWAVWSKKRRWVLFSQDRQAGTATSCASPCGQTCPGASTVATAWAGPSSSDAGTAVWRSPGTTAGAVAGSRRAPRYVAFAIVNAASCAGCGRRPGPLRTGGVSASGNSGTLGRGLREVTLVEGVSYMRERLPAQVADSLHRMGGCPAEFVDAWNAVTNQRLQVAF